MKTIERHIQVFTQNAPLASHPEPTHANLHRGINAVGKLMAFVTGGTYFHISEPHPRNAVPFPINVLEGTPDVVLEIISGVAQRVFDRVANGEQHTTVLEGEQATLETQLQGMPGPDNA